jgi:beta-lactam-binding protein with PASTA domain
MYDVSNEQAGTILAQKPEPGTSISGPITLEFVVSRGPENTVTTIPQFTGLEISQALELIGRTGINFEFALREPASNEKGEIVVNQTPPANTSAPIDTVVHLTVTAPAKLADNEVSGLFRYSMPKNPYPLAVRLEALLPLGERLRILSVEYPGGELTVPYKLPAGSALVLSLLNREIHRETVRAQH